MLAKPRSGVGGAHQGAEGGAGSTGEEVGSALALQVGKPIARWEWICIILLCVGCLVFWSTQYHYFHVPMSDYLTFEENARRIWAGRLPRNFKRMPTFPILIGLPAKAIPGDHPEIHPALFLNMCFSAGSLILIFLISRRWIGWMAIVPTALTAAHQEFSTWAMQPIGEPCNLFFLLLSIFLFLRKSLWQYAAALAASLCRYDFVTVIPILCLLNLVYARPSGERVSGTAAWRLRRKHLLLALAASSGLILWGALILARPYARVPYKPWIRSGPIERMSGWYILTTMTEPFGLRYSGTGDAGEIVAIAGVSLVFLLGAYVSLGLPVPKRVRGPMVRRGTLALVLFLGAYVFIHVLFGVNNTRYTHATLWMVQLFVVAAFASLCRAVGPGISRLWNKYTGYVVGALLAVSASAKLGTAGGDLFFVKSVRPGPFYLAFACVVIAVLVGYCVLRFRRPGWVLLPGAAAMTLVTGLFVFENVEQCARHTLGKQYHKYEYFLAAKWLKGNLREGEKAVILQRQVIRYYAGLTNDDIERLRNLDASNHEELISEMTRKRIRYLVFGPRGSLYSKKKPTRGKYIGYKTFLLEPFKEGKDVPGFRKIVTLEMPDESGRHHGYIYELVMEDR